jgi:hypothetical protein
MRKRARAGVDRLWLLVLFALRAFGRRRALAVTVVGSVGLAGSAAFGVVTGGPLPAIHDEFAYLLAADTFANWRLTNPPHPHWEHFETFHELMQPTYASKYPPGQGLALAFGQVLTGTPAAGVWISAGVMAGAITWMLLVWLPPQWAVTASVFSAIQLTWLSYWGHSYWGGAVAATGGALAFGAYRQLTRNPGLRPGLILGIGLGILALSRPYEGAVAGSCIAVSLAHRLVSAGARDRTRRLQALAGAACVIVATLAWLGYYNWRVTGSASTMPHQEYQVQYSANPLLLIGTARPRPTYRHAELERLFLEWGEKRQRQQRSPLEIARVVPIKLSQIVYGVLGIGSLGLLGLPTIIRRRSLRFVFVALLAVVGASLLTAGSFPHYVAPAACLFYVILGAALSALHHKARRHQSTNFAIVSGLLLVALTPLLLFWMRSPYRDFAINRAAVIRQLEALPENSLVFVTYEPTHSIHEEWVYNEADIDNSRVVWARSMSEAKNQALIAYFANRQVWWIAPDRSLTLQPHPPPAS